MVGAEEAEWAVDLDGVAIGHCSLHPVNEPVKLELAEELAIARRTLVANLGIHADRTQQNGLCQGNVVTIDEPLSGHVLELEQPVFVSEVGEEGLQQGFRRQLQLQGDGREHLVAAKRGSGRQADGVFLARSCRAQPAAGLGRRGKDLVPNLLGWDVGDDLELGPVFQNLGDSTMGQRRLSPAAEELVNFFLDLAAGHTHTLAKNRQQALGRLQPLRVVAVQVKRDDPLFGCPDADKITGEHEHPWR